MAKKKAAGLSSATVKISDLMRPEFQLAMAELMNSDLIPIESSWILLQVFECVDGFQKHYEELRFKLLNRYGKKGADGKLEMNEKKTEFLLDDKPGFDKAFADLCNLQVEVKQVPLSAVKGAKLSPAKLSCLVKTIVNPSL